MQILSFETQCRLKERLYEELTKRLEIFYCINSIEVKWRKSDLEAHIYIDPIKWLGDKLALSTTITETIPGTAHIIGCGFYLRIHVDSQEPEDWHSTTRF